MALNFKGKQAHFDNEVVKNDGHVASFVMKHMPADMNETKNYYLLVYMPNNKHPQNKTPTFTVRIVDNSDETQENKQTITRIAFNQDGRMTLIAEENSSKDYHYIAGKWLVDSFYGRMRYNYSEVNIVLPPEYGISFDRSECGEIEYLKINVPAQETNVNLVTWWLTRFDMKIHCIKIVTSITVQITACRKLKEGIERVEIEGPCNIDVDFLRTFEGACLYWNNLSNQLEKADMYRACMDCVETKKLKAIYLNQRSLNMSKEIVQQLNHLYNKGRIKDATHFSFKHDKFKFRFRLTQHHTVFGNITDKEHMDLRHARDWLKIIL